jgi:hypothetical protein
VLTLPYAENGQYATCLASCPAASQTIECFVRQNIGLNALEDLKAVAVPCVQLINHFML